jgi:hypothetical protein
MDAVDPVWVVPATVAAVPVWAAEVMAAPAMADRLSAVVVATVVRE